MKENPGDQRKSFMRIMRKTAAEPFTKPTSSPIPEPEDRPLCLVRSLSLSGKQNAPADRIGEI